MHKKQCINWVACVGLVNQHIFNTLRPRQDGCHFADDIFKCIFLNENVWIPIKISLKFIPKGPINNISELVQIMAWRRPGDKPLSEPMLVSLLTHICVTRPQWVKAAVHYKEQRLCLWTTSVQGLILGSNNILWYIIIKQIRNKVFIYGILNIYRNTYV